MIMKCKPTYQFQSIEFDFEIVPEIDEDTQIKEMFEYYDKILKGLQKIAPVQDQKSPQAINGPLATQRQKDCMDLYGIKYDPNITSKDAQALIQKSINKG